MKFNGHERASILNKNIAVGQHRNQKYVYLKEQQKAVLGSHVRTSNPTKVQNIKLAGMNYKSTLTLGHHLNP